MPASNMNIGRDNRVVIQHPLAPNGRLDIDHITGFHPRQVTAQVMAERLDGKVLSATLPRMWTGEITVTRGSRALDEFVSVLETAHHNGINVPSGQVFSYITETDGSVTTYLYEECSFALPEAGRWQNDQSVTQTLSFTASRRRAV